MNLPGIAAWKQFLNFILVLSAVTSPAAQMQALASPQERKFPQAKAIVEREAKKLQAAVSGPLPVLEGFAQPADLPLERFSQGYYHCSVTVSSLPSGESRVRVKAKITAWFGDPSSTKAGYQVLASNGRLESDFLGRLAEVLARESASSPAKTAPNTEPPPEKAQDAGTPLISAPEPQTANNGGAAPKGQIWPPFKPPFAQPVGSAVQPGSTSPDSQQLADEARSLEAILQSQTHPSNLVAVKQAGTPVLVNPSEGAKVLFLAAAEDEYEILDVNANWVHVRISGLSRGWIRRSNVEMLDATAAGPPPTNEPTARQPAADAEAQFQVESEQIASFPAAWEPLRGKTVKIISLKKTGDRNSDAQSKLALAKSLFDTQYTELTKSASTAAGVVLIFDSADGGMMAATMPVLSQWKQGTLSDEGLWRRSYFDPPELRGTSK